MRIFLLALFVAALLLGQESVCQGQGRDTAFAVHKLFRQKRGSGEGWAATGATVMAGEIYQNRPTGSNIAAAAVLGGVPATMGLMHASRYSPEREAAILQSYANGWSIPPDIRRKLRRKHFRVKARDLSPRAY